MNTFDELPVGYKFDPTKEELVGYFLKGKLNGQLELPSVYYPQFLDYDVYKDHPFNTLANNEQIVINNEGYFFTPLTLLAKDKTKRNKKARSSRSIDNYGTWAEKAGTKDVYDEAGTTKIGEYKYYKYKPSHGNKDGDLNDKYEFCMHEYSLLNDKNLVLSRITRKSRKNSPNTNQATNDPNDVIIMNSSGDDEDRYVLQDGQVCKNNNYNDNSNNVDPCQTSFNDSLLLARTNNNIPTNMKMDNTSVDEAGPSKRSRVNPVGTFTGEYDIFSNGYVNFMKQSIQEDHNGHNFGIPAQEMTRSLDANREMKLEELSMEDHHVIYSTRRLDMFES